MDPVDRPEVTDPDPGSTRIVAHAGRRIARIAVGIAVTVLLLGWVIRRIEDPDRFLRAVTGCRWSLVLAALGVRAALVAVKNTRWRVALRALAGRRPASTWAPLVYGYVTSCFVPMRGGELVRVQAAATRTGLSRAALLSTIVVERLLDGLVLCGLLAWTAAGIEAPGWVGTALRRTTLVLFAAALALALLSFRTGMGDRFGQGRAAMVTSLIRRFRSGIAVFRTHRGVLPAVAAITVVVWLAEGAATCLVLHAFGIAADYGLALFLAAAVTLALSVPTAPGNLGPHQAIFVVILGLRGIDAETALAASLTSQITTQLMLLALGAGTWFAGGRGKR